MFWVFSVLVGEKVGVCGIWLFFLKVVFKVVMLIFDLKLVRFEGFVGME